MRENQVHQRAATLELGLPFPFRIVKLYQKNTKISITIQGDGSEIFDYSLPLPHNYSRRGNIYTIKYTINGFFHTNKSIAYLNDILARFTLSMKVLDTRATSSEDEGIELSYFQGLKSVVRHKNYESVDIGQDNIFWAIKLYTEDLIRESGEGNLISYSLVESFAFARFIDRAKDKSTLKAKCRSIWNWYDELGWTIPKRTRKLTDEELKMTRSENAKRVAEQKADKNYKTVVNLLTGLFNDEYKKKNGKWHIGKIALAVGMTEKTVSKYIKEFENE